jgi:hypothetical protein
MPLRENLYLKMPAGQGCRPSGRRTLTLTPRHEFQVESTAKIESTGLNFSLTE